MKTILFSEFKNPYEKIRKTRKLKSIHEYHFVERKNEGRKPDKKSSQRRLKFMPRNLDRNAVQEFYHSYGLSIHIAHGFYSHSYLYGWL
jgi:ribosomal protein S21